MTDHRGSKEVTINWKFVLAVMVSFAFMMSSSYTMLIPFLPVYMQKELNCSDDAVALWSGVTFAITFAVSAIAAPLWGKLSDKMGKKPMIIRSSILISLTYLFAGLVQTPFELFLVRGFQGIAAGLWPACLVMISACVPKSRLGLSMGMMQSANICGGIAGPLLGGVLASFFGMRNSFFIGSSVLFLICLITVLFIKEPPKSEETNVKEKNNVTYFSLLKQKNILILLVCVCLTNMVILQIQPIVALYVEKLTNGAENSVMLSGLVLSLGALSGAIASPIWGRTGQKKGFARTLCLALIIAGFMIAIQGIPNNLELFALIQFICGLGFSGIFPSANSILVLFTPSSSRGTGFGLLFSAQMVGGAIGPLLGGIVVTLLSFKAVYALSGSMLLIAGLYLLLFAPKSFKQKANSTQLVNRTDAKEHIESIKSKFILDNSKDKTVK